MRHRVVGARGRRSSTFWGSRTVNSRLHHPRQPGAGGGRIHRGVGPRSTRIRQGSAGEHQQAGVPPRCSPQDLQLRPLEPGGVQPPAWARVPTQRGADVAHQPARAGPQDDRGLPPRERGRHPQGVPTVRGRLPAIDGSKFKAANSRGRNFAPTKLDRRVEQIAESVQRYLDALETADRTQPLEAEASMRPNEEFGLAWLLLGAIRRDTSGSPKTLWPSRPVDQGFAARKMGLIRSDQQVRAGVSSTYT